jgi:DNA-binding transcriptional ArsR family regulator
MNDAMDFDGTVGALGALAQETRLKTFRLLVSAGPEGVAATAIADALEVRQNLLSSHLAVLARAGLVQSRKQGRKVIYTADLDRMRALFEFLLTDCCSGHPDLCRGLIDDIASRTSCAPPARTRADA